MIDISKFVTVGKGGGGGGRGGGGGGGKRRGRRGRRNQNQDNQQQDENRVIFGEWAKGKSPSTMSDYERQQAASTLSGYSKKDIAGLGDQEWQSLVAANADKGLSTPGGSGGPDPRLSGLGSYKSGKDIPANLLPGIAKALPGSQSDIANMNETDWANLQKQYGVTPTAATGATQPAATGLTPGETTATTTTSGIGPATPSGDRELQKLVGEGPWAAGSGSAMPTEGIAVPTPGLSDPNTLGGYSQSQIANLSPYQWRMLLKNFGIESW